MSIPRRVIGVDESGKGDFFGPLVIAALLADDEQQALLKDLGVRDSKLIADKKLLEIDRQLCDKFPNSVVIISPLDYNQRYTEIRNLNKLLAWGHAEAISNLLSGHDADLAISDKFGKSEHVEKALAEREQPIPVQQLVRGERIPQVAAASILARAAFLREIERLSEKVGIKLPKGAAAHVDEAGRKIVSKHGIEILAEISKIHFKNYHRVVNPRLFA